MDVKTGLDWLQITVDDFDIDHMPSELIWGLQHCKPLGNYDSAKKDSLGIKYNINTTEIERYGLHILMTGETLRNIRAIGITDDMLLGIFRGYLRKASRIDYAVDINIQLNFRGLRTLYNKKRVKTRLGFDEEYYKSQGEEGSTVYFGGKKSDYRIKLYDKGKELGNGLTLTRIESVLKNRIATSFYHDSLKRTSQKAGNSLLLSKIKINQRWWNTMVKNLDHADSLVLHRKESNYAVWLKMILKSLKQKIENSEEQAAVQQFLSDVRKL